jgi:hypothetical protein
VTTTESTAAAGWTRLAEPPHREGCPCPPHTLPSGGMGNVILQGGNLSESLSEAAGLQDTAYGVKQSIVHAHFPMYNGGTAGAWKPLALRDPANPIRPWMPLSLAEGLWRKGQLTLLSWGSWNLGEVQPDGTKKGVPIPPADFPAGKHDDMLRMQAKHFKDWGHPIVVGFDPEMNGTWAPWYCPGPDFVSKWRYVISFMRAEGVKNVAWAWVANQTSRSKTETTWEGRLQDWWPGREYVDIIGFDTYNFAGSRNATWATFTEIMSGNKWIGDTYGAASSLAPDLPMMLGEWGCDNKGGDKVAWITDALAVLPVKYPRLMIASYYGLNDGASHWALDAADGTAAAWADGIKRGPYVQGGDFVLPSDNAVLRPFTRTLVSGDPLADNAALNLRLVDTTGQLVTARQTIADLQADLATTAQQLAAATTDIAQVRADLAAAVQRVADAESREAEIQNHLRALVNFATPQAA